MPKKDLTKRIKTYYNGSIPIKHCGKVMAFTFEGRLYLQCKRCRKWVEIELNK